MLDFIQCTAVLCILIFEISSIPGPECISCEYIGCTDTRVISIGGHGLDICDEGQVKDTRGECKTAYTFIPPKEEEVVENEESTERPRRPRNLRAYLRSKYSFLTI